MNDANHYTSKYKDVLRNQVTEKQSYQSEDGRNKTDYTKTSQTYQTPSGDVRERTVEERKVYSYPNTSQQPPSYQPPAQPPTQPPTQPPQQAPRQRNLFKLLYGNQVGNYDKYNLEDRESPRTVPTVVERSSPAGESPFELINKDTNIEISMPHNRLNFDQTDGNSGLNGRNGRPGGYSSDAEVGHYTDVHKSPPRIQTTEQHYRSPLFTTRTSPSPYNSHPVIKINSYTQTPVDNRLSDEERRRLEDNLAQQHRLQAERDNDNRELQRQMAGLRELNRTLKDQNDHLRNSHSTTTTTTVEERRRFEDNIAQVRKMLAERENEILELQRQMSGVREVSRTLKDENDRLISSHSSTTTSRVVESERLEGIIAQLRKQFGDREDENHELQRQMSGLRDVNRTLKDENDRLTSSHMSTNTTTMEERKRLLDNVAELRRLLAEREDEVRELQRQLSMLRDDNRSLKDEKEHLNIIRSSTTTLEEEVRRLEGIIAQLRKQLGEREDENHELQTQLSSQRDMNRSLKDEIDRLKSSRISTTTTSVEERKRLEDSVSHQRKLLSDRDNEIRDIQRQLSSVQNVNRSLKDELDELKSNHVSNTLISEFERKILQITNEKDIMGAKVTRLNDEIQYLRNKNNRNAEENPNINDLLKKIAALESENLILTQSNEVARSELSRRDRTDVGLGLVTDKDMYGSHGSKSLHDDRYCPYKYKVNSPSYSSSHTVTGGDAYKSRYTDKYRHNGYNKSIEETIHNTPTTYSRNRSEYVDDNGVPAMTSNGVSMDRSRRSHQSTMPSRSYSEHRLTDLGLHDSNTDSRIYTPSETVNSHLNNEFFPELTKYSNFNAGDLVSAQYHRRLESDNTKVYTRPRSADGRTFYNYSTASEQTNGPSRKYQEDHGDMSDTPTDILLGSNPMDRILSRSSPRYIRRTSLSDSSLSDVDEGYQTIYRKRSKSVLGRGRFDDALYVNDPPPAESVHYHITQVRPSVNMEGLAPIHQQLEASPSLTGYRSVLPKPLITQQNKHLHSSSQSTINFSNSVTQGLRPYSPSSPTDIKTNDIIKFSRQGGKLSIGFVRFVGNLPGRSGVYLGVELYKEEGKHDGTFDDVRYFKCKPNKGVFVAFNKVVMAWTSF